MARSFNFNDSTPAPPATFTNVKWQRDSQDPESVSAYIPFIVNLYDVIWSLPGPPFVAITYLVIPFRLAANFPANFAASVGRCLTNPTATATFTLKKLTAGGVTTTIGTFAISTSGVFTFTSTGGAAQSFAIGDSLLIVTPSPADATLADVAITLAGNR
jgi:hypothetical protein